jgi:hypothetical protein
MSDEQDLYPEHTKLKAVVSQSQAIGGFIEWLGEQGMWICKLYKANPTCEGEYLPVTGSINELLAKHFEIDLKKLESEKRALLEEQRRLNNRG